MLDSLALADAENETKISWGLHGGFQLDCAVGAGVVAGGGKEDDGEGIIGGGLRASRRPGETDLAVSGGDDGPGEGLPGIGAIGISEDDVGDAGEILDGSVLEILEIHVDGLVADELEGDGDGMGEFELRGENGDGVG
jgi:hypothetical protein